MVSGLQSESQTFLDMLGLIDLSTGQKLHGLYKVGLVGRRWIEHQMAQIIETTVGLTAEEERLWQHYEYVEHLVRIAKAKALSKLKAA